jgi:hypothetical protein
LIYVILLLGVWAGLTVISQRNDDRKLPWDTLTITLLDKELSQSSVIPLYSADPHLQYPLWFYLDCLRTSNLGPFGRHLGSRTDLPELAAKSARFEITRVSDLRAAQGRYFWLGYSDSNRTDAIEASQILHRPGCRMGDAISARDRFHTVTLVPVQCW